MLRSAIRVSLSARSVSWIIPDGLGFYDSQRTRGRFVELRWSCLIPMFAMAATAVGMAVAAPAAADCNYSGGSTLCSSGGDVRGGSAPPQAVYDPYPCGSNDPLCAYVDVYDPLLYLDDDRLGRPGGPGDRPGGPGRPGGGGGRPGGGPR